MIFQTGSAEIPNITQVPLPWGQTWQWCPFLENFVGSSSSSFLGHWIQPTWVSLLETSPTVNERENEQLLCCWNKELVLWHTLLWWLPARLHFSTSHSMLCGCHCTAGFKCQYLCILSGHPLMETVLRACSAGFRVKGKTNPFCMDHENFIKEPFCSAWEGRRMKNGKTTCSKGFNQYLQAAWLSSSGWPNKNLPYLSLE